MQAPSSFHFYQMKTESLAAAALLLLKGLVYIPRITMLRKGGLMASGYSAYFQGFSRLAEGMSVANA